MQNKVIINVFALIVLVSLPLSMLSAQETFSNVTSDFESWNSIRVKVKLNKKFTTTLEQGLRLAINSTSLDQALSELGANYKFTKSFEIGVATRYTYDRNKSDNFKDKLRYNFDASYKTSLNRFDFKLRLRYQKKYELVSSQEVGDDPQSYFRVKLNTSYNIKKWKLDPQFSAEIFRDLETDGNFDKVRFSIGTAYDMKKAGEIAVFYRIENEMNTILPKTTYIAGLKYTYTFKTYKK